MKAIFAVSALAAAISAQAIAADTEATTTYTGGVKVEFTHDLDASQGDGPNINGDDTKLEGSVSVANGPFSGTLKFTDGDEVEVSDLKVDNGTLSFGDIGSIVTTEAPVDGMSEDTDYAVDAAFRYTNADMGLKVQFEKGITKTTYEFDVDGDGAANDKVQICSADSTSAGYLVDGTAVSATAPGSCDEEKEWELEKTVNGSAGLAIAYMADYDVAAVTADLQYRVDADYEAFKPYLGLKVTSSPVDMLSLTAAYTMGSSMALASGTDSAVSSYGVRADVTAMEGVTAYASYADADGDTKTQAGVKAVFAPVTATVDWVADDEITAKVSAEQAMDALTLSGYGQYKVEAAEFEAQAKAVYAISDMTSATASVTSFNGDNLEVIASVTHTTEDGISLSATFESDDRPSPVSNAKDDDNYENSIKLAASYSF